MSLKDIHVMFLAKIIQNITRFFTLRRKKMKKIKLENEKYEL